MGRQAGGQAVAALVVLVTVLVVVGAAWVFQRSLIYLPGSDAVPPARHVLDDARDVVLHTVDGLELGAWHVPARCGMTVLVAPGNGGNRAGRAELARSMVDRGLGVLLLDYRGYGSNPGSPTEEGSRLDARAALDFLAEQGAAAPADLLYLGESLGAAVVSDLALDHPPAAIVLRSPFTSLADAARANYGIPVGWLLRDHYRVREAVSELQVDLTVVYGEADRIVPAAQSRDVAAAAREAGNAVTEVALPGLDHNDAALARGPEVVDAVVAAAQRAGYDCG